MVCCACLFSPVALGQDAEEDWPMEIDYPPNSQYISPEQFNAATDSVQEQLTGRKPQSATAGKTESKKSWWPFGRKKREEEALPTEEQIVNVGPREHPAAREPLFRLPVGVMTPEGRTLQAGFYLVRPVPVNDTTYRLQLLQEGRLMLETTAQMHDYQAPSGPVGPVEPMKPQPMLTHVIPQLSPDHTQLTIVVRQGNQELRTPPLPTILTARRELRF